MNANAILNTIEEKVNDYLAKFDLRGELDTDFAYYRDGLVTYSVIVTERFDNLFLNYCET